MSNVYHSGPTADALARDDEVQYGELGVSWLFWLISVPVLYQLIKSAPVRGAELTGWASILMGVQLYISHGGGRVTAAALYGIATAIFVGGTTVFWHMESPDLAGQMAFHAWVGYAACVVMACVFWRRWRRGAWPRPVAESRGLVQLAGVMWLISVVLASSQPAFIHVCTGLTVVFLASFLAPSAGGSVTMGGRILLALIVFAVFFLQVFTGYGRLIVVGLAVAVFVVYSGYLERRLMKWLSLVALFPVISFLIFIRESGAGDLEQGLDGSGSIVNPLATFRELTEYLQRTGDFGRGDSFLATFTFWVPRSMWPEKPIGFGSQLTTMLRPDADETTYSMAALATGEWYYNWQVMGLWLMIPCVGLMVLLIDKALDGAFRQAVRGRRGLVWLAAMAVVVAGIPTYVWVGSFTFVSRSVQSLVPLLVLALLVGSARQVATRQGQTGLRT